MQTYRNVGPLEIQGNNMATFVARLMSLSAHEIQCLHSDSELMRYLTHTQLLMETRLQHLSHQQSKVLLHKDQAYAYQLQQQQQQQHYHQQQQPHYFPQNLSTYQHQQEQHQHQHQHQHQFQNQLSHQNQHLLLAVHNHNQLALDLRTGASCQQSPGDPGAHYAHSACSSASTLSLSPSVEQSRPKAFNPKKVKLSEYQEQQQETFPKAINAELEQRLSPAQLQLSSAITPTRDWSPHDTLTAAKKYKGEFDEPSPAEVELRQRLLARSDNYHAHCWASGRCACILGSEFRDKSAASVLAMINEWQNLDTQQRVRSKWDVGDLPKDIPLGDIKKFEDLRREASNGRADFGGASKRKPLGIRGTRQFLLILYCLWGHPGRDDVMQKEGYCPHCFAKIKKANEQSTLVRVVNHFNMKHRRGANPRLSPNRDNSMPTLAPALRPSNANQLAVVEPESETSEVGSAILNSSPMDERQLTANILLQISTSNSTNLSSTSPTSTTPPTPEPSDIKGKPMR